MNEFQRKDEMAGVIKTVKEMLKDGFSLEAAQKYIPEPFTSEEDRKYILEKAASF